MSDEVGPPVGGPEVRAEPYAFYRRAGPDLLVGALVPGGLDEPAVVHLHVAVGVEGRPVDGDAEVLVDHDVLERPGPRRLRSEEHTSELQSLMRISYAVFCLKKKTTNKTHKQKQNTCTKHTKNQ